MTAGILFALAWKSTACAGGTLLILWALRNRSAAERSLLAHLGLLLAVLTPLAAWALPPVRPPLEVQGLGLAAPLSEIRPLADAGVAGAVPGEAGALAAAAGFDIELLGTWLYGAPALLLGLSLAVGVVQLQRLRMKAEVVTEPRWLHALATAQRRAGFNHAAALLVSSDLSSPVSWGVLRPVVMLDAATHADPLKAEAVVAHELAHLARLDWAKLLLAGAATAVFWFNPLVWLLARRCHDLREEAADDAVLRAEIAPADYAEVLVGCARRESRWMAANGMAARPGSLAGRIGRVLDPTRPRRPARAGWVLGSWAAALVFAAPLALSYTAADRAVAAAADAPVASAPQAVAATPLERGRPALASAVQPNDPSLAAVVRAAQPAPEEVPAPPAPYEAAPAYTVSAVPPTGPAEALSNAAGRGDLHAMNRILDAGVDPDAVAPGDGSALIEAARSGRTEAVRQLLRRGADVDMTVDGDGSPLIAAAAAGRLETVKLLLDAGADIETSIPSDENALIQASWRGHEAVVRLLLARGADPNAQVGPRTALRMARTAGRRDIERMLKEAGATR